MAVALLFLLPSSRVVSLLLGLRRRFAGPVVLGGAAGLVVGRLVCAKHLDDALEGEVELLARRSLRVIRARLLIGLLVALEIRLLQFAEFCHLRELLEQLIALAPKLGELLLEHPDSRVGFLQLALEDWASLTARHARTGDHQ